MAPPRCFKSERLSPVDPATGTRYLEEFAFE